MQNKTMPMINWRFENVGNKSAELFIYDDIGESFFGEGISAKQFAEDLDGLGDVNNITVRINSYGGVVSDGVAIYNLLNKHDATINVAVDGFALSAASVIAMAGDEIAMAENATMMIHNARGLVMGDKDDMINHAAVLEKLDVGIGATYAARTGKSRGEIADLMNASTWMTADEAVEMGFADTINAAKGPPAPAPGSGEDKTSKNSRSSGSSVGPGGMTSGGGSILDYYNVPEKFVAQFTLTASARPAQIGGSIMESTKMTAAEFATANPDAVKNWKADGFKDGFKDGHDKATKAADAPVPAIAMTVDEFVEANPDTIKDWKNEGFVEGHDTAIKEERDRAQALNETFADRPVFANEQYVKGHDIMRAKADLADVLITENASKDEMIANNKKALDEANKATDQANKATADLEAGADPIVLRQTINPDDKYEGMSDSDRIDSEWADNFKNCQDKFKVIAAYAPYRHGQFAKQAAKQSA